MFKTDPPFEGFSGLHDYQSQTSKVLCALVIAHGDPVQFFKLRNETTLLSVNEYLANIDSTQNDIRQRVIEDIAKYPQRVKKIDELMLTIKTTDSFAIAKRSLKNLCDAST